MVTFSCHDLVVVGAEVHAVAGPRVEVVGHGDGSTGALLLADAPVLVERAGAVDGWLVHTCCFVDVVGSAIGGDGSFEFAGGTVGAPAFDDVVLDEWASGPPVEGEVAVSGGVELG